MLKEDDDILNNWLYENKRNNLIRNKYAILQ